MVRLEKLEEVERNMLLGFKCPSFESNPGVTGPPLSQRCVVFYRICIPSDWSCRMLP